MAKKDDDVATVTSSEKSEKTEKREKMHQKLKSKMKKLKKSKSATDKDLACQCEPCKKQALEVTSSVRIILFQPTHSLF
uniref:Uncharacterized protein n=1 Tax=Caenorhabditis japonica TaxID=281687 RepID=A0A8R1EFE0_CAEJA